MEVFTLTIQAKRGTIAVVAVILFLFLATEGYALASRALPAFRSPALAVFHRVASHPPQHANWEFRNFHKSRVGRDSSVEYVDGPRPFWFEYTGCPATARGAFRITAYKARRGDPSAGLVRPEDVTAFSKTLVDYKTSDKGWYTYPSKKEYLYLFHIDVPSKKGCASWSWGVLPDD